jgi:hypothetical protein
MVLAWFAWFVHFREAVRYVRVTLMGFFKSEFTTFYCTHKIYLR